MFPLKSKAIGGFTFGQKYPASFGSLAGHPHLGVDYKANFVELRAPFDGRIERHDGTQGGITLWFFYKGFVMRFMHLSEVRKTGEVKEGDLIAITGNTGSATTGAHLHLDISKNNININNFSNFVNPEGFDWSDMIPENLLPDRLQRDPDGKIWWWTLDSSWYHYRDDLVVQRPDYNQIINDLTSQLGIAKTNVINLSKEIVELNKTIDDNAKTHATKLTTCENIKDKAIEEKGKTLTQLANLQKNYYQIPKNIVSKIFSKITNIIHR